MLGLAWMALAMPAAAATVKRTGPRAYRVTVSGAPQADLTITRLDFRLGAYARHPTRRSLRVSLAGPTGRSYLAAARLLPARRGTLTALVALVNLVSLDIAGTRLTHRPRASEVVGAFAQRARASALAPPMCRQTLRTLAGRDVAAALASGPAFGFSPRNVVAQSFDAACSRPVDPAFQRAVTAFGRCPPCGPPGPVARAAAAAIPCPAAQPAIVCPE